MPMRQVEEAAIVESPNTDYSIRFVVTNLGLLFTETSFSLCIATLHCPPNNHHVLIIKS